MRSGTRHVVVALLAMLGFTMLGFPREVRAAIMVITPIGASASNEINATIVAPRTIDGSGLGGAVPTTINTVADLPKHNEDPNNTTGFAGGMWLTAASPGTVTITFDLGTPTTVDTLIVWNYAEVAFANTVPVNNTNRSAKNVTLLADNTPTPSTTIQSFVFNQANPTPVGSTNVSVSPFFNEDYSTAADIYSLSAPVTARYFRFSISSDYGAGSGYIGLSEVRFGATPEPASVAVLGMGALLTLRRRCAK